MEFLEMLAASGIGAGLAFGLLRLWLDRRLGLEMDKKLETFKHGLAKEIEEHRTKSEIEINERHRVYKTISESLDSASVAWNRIWVVFVADRDNPSPPSNENLYTVASNLTAVTSIVRHEMLYLDKDLVKEVEDKLHPFLSVVIETIVYDPEAIYKRSEEFLEDVNSFNLIREELIKKMRDTM